MIFPRILPQLSTIIRHLQRVALYLIENPVVAIILAGGLMLCAVAAMIFTGRAAFDFGFSDPGAHLLSTLGWGILFCTLMLATFWGIQRFAHGIVGFIAACLGSYVLTIGVMAGIKAIFTFLKWVMLR